MYGLPLFSLVIVAGMSEYVDIGLGGISCPVFTTDVTTGLASPLLRKREKHV